MQNKSVSENQHESGDLKTVERVRSASRHRAWNIRFNCRCGKKTALSAQGPFAYVFALKIFSCYMKVQFLLLVPNGLLGAQRAREKSR